MAAPGGTGPIGPFPTHVAETDEGRDEYDRRLAYLVFDYVRFVARRPGRLRDERFRAYHRQVARDLASGVRTSELLHGTTLQIRRMLARRRRAAR